MKRKTKRKTCYCFDTDGVLARMYRAYEQGREFHMSGKELRELMEEEPYILGTAERHANGVHAATCDEDLPFC